MKKRKPLKSLNRLSSFKTEKLENDVQSADLRAFRQDNLSFPKDASNITFFFPTAGPPSRTKLGTDICWDIYCGEAGQR